MGDLATLDVAGGAVTLREAVPGDLPEVVALLAADQLGIHRESADDLAPYRMAFDAITTDPAHLLVVAVDGGGRIIGTMQLSFIPGLARRGVWRAQIEAVRVHEAARNRGVGARMIGWAVEEARKRGARSSSSPPTNAAPTPIGSTSASGSWPHTRG